MSQTAEYDDFYQFAYGTGFRAPQALVYADIALGCAGGDSFVAYRVCNPTSQAVTETVQLYVEIVYPSGLMRKRMVGWEVHRLTPGADRYVRIGQCGIIFPPSADADAGRASLRVKICSLSRLRSQASWCGDFNFEDMKIPPAEGGSPFSGR